MAGLITANLRRRRMRTAITAAGIAFGVAAIVALLALSDGLNQTAAGLVHLGRADLGLFQRNASDPTTSVLPVSLLPRVRAQREVREATPIQLIVGGIDHAPGAVVLGVDPNGFVARLLVLTRGLRFDHGSVDVGDQLAHQLRLRPGSTLRVSGHRFRVAGVFHSGIAEQDTGVVMLISDAQAVSGRTPDEATTFAVRLMPQTSAAKGTRELTRAFPSLLAIADPSEAVRAGVNNQLISNAVLLIVVLALIIGALGVANTMLAAVLERRRELALLTTIGWSPSQLGGLVLGEAVAVSILGTGVGLLLGLAASKLLPGALGLGPFITPVLTVWTLIRAILIGILIGVLGAVYPMWRVTRVQSVAALAEA
jgi:putative ABC transport system permease protein